MSLEGKVSSVTTNMEDVFLISLDVAKFNFQEARCVLHKLEQVLLLNGLPGHSEVKQLDHVNILLE